MVVLLRACIRASIAHVESRHSGRCQLHPCVSHGTPSLSPSILVPGQCLMKYVASAHERMCEQCVRPSHLNWVGAAGASALDAGADAAAAIGAPVVRAL